MKYYWVTVDFELMGNDYSDRFLLKHNTTISKEETALQALQATFSRITRLSLFDSI